MSFLSPSNWHCWLWPGQLHDRRGHFRTSWGGLIVKCLGWISKIHRIQLVEQCSIGWRVCLPINSVSSTLDMWLYGTPWSHIVGIKPILLWKCEFSHTHALRVVYKLWILVSRCRLISGVKKTHANYSKIVCWSDSEFDWLMILHSGLSGQFLNSWFRLPCSCSKEPCCSKEQS